MRFEGQVVSAAIPGIAERAAGNLPIPQIGKNLALPRKMEAQARARILDGISSFPEAAQKPSATNPRLLRSCLLNEAICLPVLSGGRWAVSPTKDHNFASRKFDSASFFQKRPA